ncbi:uncharacterized protein LOC136031269 isoform X2 [Artemia franciscana]|uniref:Uncharacterized protein n=1 Tax=Artemia franciscana TaxID=6661 RepID=A0AA88KW61_ARTSF|nr:hypothetical protein QYM36_016771 [Artemia franciscana]
MLSNQQLLNLKTRCKLNCLSKGSRDVHQLKRHFKMRLTLVVKQTVSPGATFEKYANSLHQSQQAILQLTATIGDLLKSQRCISALEPTPNKLTARLGPSAPILVEEDIREGSSSSSNESLIEEVKRMKFEVENYRKVDNSSFFRKKERKNRRKLALHSEIKNLREELSELKRKNEEVEVRTGFEYRENASKMAEEVRNLKFHQSFDTALKDVKDKFQVESQLYEFESKQREEKVKMLEKELQKAQVELENLKIENRNIPKLREDKINLLAKVNEQKDLIESLRGMVEEKISLVSQNGEIGALLAEEKSKHGKTEYELRRLRREMAKCIEKNLKLESEVAPKVCVLTEEKLALEGELNALRYRYSNLDKELNIIRSQKEEVLKRNVILKSECRLYRKEINDLKEGEISRLNETTNVLFYAKRRIETELIECKTKLNEAVDSLEAAYKHIEIQSSQITSFSDAPSSLTLQYLSEACKKLSLLESEIKGHKSASARQVGSPVNREAKLSKKHHSLERGETFQKSYSRVPLLKSPLVPSSKKVATYFSSEATSSDVESRVNYGKAHRKGPYREIPKGIVRKKLTESELSSSEHDLMFDHINRTATNIGQTHDVKSLNTSSSERKSKALNFLMPKENSFYKYRASFLPFQSSLSNYVISNPLASSSKKSSYEGSEVEIFEVNNDNSIIDSRSDDSRDKILPRSKNFSSFQNPADNQESLYLTEKKLVAILPISSGIELGSKVDEEPSFTKILHRLNEPREEPSLDISDFSRNDLINSSQKSLASFFHFKNAPVNSSASNPLDRHIVSEEKMNPSDVKENNTVVDARSDDSSYKRKPQIDNLSLFENPAECLPQSNSKSIPCLPNASISASKTCKKKTVPNDDHALNKLDKILLKVDISTPQRSDKDGAILKTSIDISAAAKKEDAILCSDLMGENGEKENFESLNESSRQENNFMDHNFSPKANIYTVQLLSKAAGSQRDRENQYNDKSIHEIEDPVLAILTREVDPSKPSTPSKTQPPLCPEEDMEEQELSHHHDKKILTVSDSEQVDLLNRPLIQKESFADDARKAPVEIKMTGKLNTSDSHPQFICPAEDFVTTSDRKRFGHTVVQEGQIEKDIPENYSQKRFMVDRKPEKIYGEFLNHISDFSGGQLNSTQKGENNEQLLKAEIEQQFKTNVPSEDISDSVTLDGPPLIKALADSIKATNFESFDIVKQSSPDSILKNLARKLPFTFESDESLSGDFPEFNPALLAALKSGTSEQPEYDSCVPVSFSDSLTRHKDLMNRGTGDNHTLKNIYSVSGEQEVKLETSPVDNTQNCSRNLSENGAGDDTPQFITSRNIMDDSRAILSHIQNGHTVKKAEDNVEQNSVPDNSSSVNLSKRSSDDDSFWN